MFIALDTALSQAKEDERVDIIGIINNMRYQRMKMVQTLVRTKEMCRGIEAEKDQKSWVWSIKSRLGPARLGMCKYDGLLCFQYQGDG